MVHLHQGDYSSTNVVMWISEEAVIYNNSG